MKENADPRKTTRQWPNWIAALVLAVTTLTAFGQLQHAGPESAIRKFHEGVWSRDPVGVQAVSASRIEESSARWLIAKLSAYRPVLTGYRIARVDRFSPNEVRAAVLYELRDPRFPGSTAISALVWVVRREANSAQWRIDTDRMATIRRDMTGGW